MGLILSIIFGLLPSLVFAAFVYWLDRFEKEPKSLLLAVFTWGAIVAAGLAFTINSMVGSSIYIATGSRDATQLTTGSLVAPIVEESLKGVAVLFVALAFRHLFDSVLDGLVYAGIAALGFAATENIYYIYNYGFVDHGLRGVLDLFFVRVVLVGWQHPFFTAFTGIGLALARMTRSLPVKIIAPIAGWSSAVLTHSLHNTLSTMLPTPSNSIFASLVDWIGWILMGVFILITLVREQHWVSQALRDEITYGVITPAQYSVATSPWKQSLARLVALGQKRFHETNRFYQLCGVLANKKRLYLSVGDEDGNLTRIQSLRSELLTLSPCVVTDYSL
jgi:RsiW-degrading membrane proteinase PrsW (M82 family)